MLNKQLLTVPIRPEETVLSYMLIAYALFSVIIATKVIGFPLLQLLLLQKSQCQIHYFTDDFILIVVTQSGIQHF